MTGILYLCATPIGNLGDMTPRVVETLRSVDLIAAEDTRNSIKLLNHFEIRTPMTSYHEYNKIEKGRKLVEKLQEGKDVALITDAGTPGISDPGEELVRMCKEAGIAVTSLPGACACITALTLSGMSTRRFLPQDKKERRRILDEVCTETRTMIFYEAPHRLVKTLRELENTLGSHRRITVCRELTKKYETVYSDSLGGAVRYYEEVPPKGECVLVLEGKSQEEVEEEQKKGWMPLSVEEHLQIYLNQGMDKKEAMKRTAKDRGVSKRDIYQEMIGKKGEI